MWCGFLFILTIFIDFPHFLQLQNHFIVTCPKFGTDIKSPIFAFDYIEIPVSSSQYPDGCPERFYVDFNEAPGLPEEVVIRDYSDGRNGDCVPFTDLISSEEIAKLIENSLKSDK